jgi:glycosyltransferase involved in cell wall biosynthesis
MQPLVDILLATYNGAVYLPEQLDSLFGQTCQDFRLLVRDDGSTDGTLAILARYSDEHSGRVVMLPSDGRRLGASASFGALLAQSAARYAMFCDQDDVWLPDKVATTVAGMRALEQSHGAESPLLVNTDLKVVDEHLAVLDESFRRFSRIHPERLDRLPRVLMQNFVTGCTAMVNRPLVALALPIPADAVMHDWWLALVVTAFGRALPIPQATVLYRQHPCNDVGATRWSFWTGINNQLFHRDRRRAAVARQQETYAILERQAAAFAARFGERLTPAEKDLIGAFCTLGRRGWLARRRLMLQHGFLLSDRWQSFMPMVR